MHGASACGTRILNCDVGAIAERGAIGRYSALPATGSTCASSSALRRFAGLIDRRSADWLHPYGLAWPRSQLVRTQLTRSSPAPRGARQPKARRIAARPPAHVWSPLAHLARRTLASHAALARRSQRFAQGARQPMQLAVPASPAHSPLTRVAPHGPAPLGSAAASACDVCSPAGSLESARQPQRQGRTAARKCLRSYLRPPAEKRGGLRHLRPGLLVPARGWQWHSSARGCRGCVRRTRM